MIQSDKSTSDSVQGIDGTPKESDSKKRSADANGECTPSIFVSGTCFQNLFFSDSGSKKAKTDGVES